MEKWKSNTLIVTIAMALGALLVIQLFWLRQSADLKEDHFNQRLTMAVCKALESMSENNGVCSRSSSCSIHDNPRAYNLRFSPASKAAIDSTIRHYLAFYEIYLPAEIHVDDKLTSSVLRVTNTSNDTGKVIDQFSNAIIRVNFPTKSEFIKGEMNSMFFVSFILIMMLITVFWLTMKSLIKERKIYQQSVSFINTMAHELKTPIANIGLSMSMLKRDQVAQDAKLVRHYSSIANEENTRLRLRVEGILGIASLEEVIKDPVSSKHSMHKLINKTISNFEIQLQVLHGKIITDLNASQDRVVGIGEQLQSVVTNLIDNAIKYTDGAPSILIKTWNSKGQFYLSITDEGVGISEENQKKIFDEFFRIVQDVNGRVIPGSGLGLSMVKKILSNHKGEIKVQSESGKGSCFTLRFPVATI